MNAKTTFQNIVEGIFVERVFLFRNTKREKSWVEFPAFFPNINLLCICFVWWILITIKPFYTFEETRLQPKDTLLMHLALTQYLIYTIKCFLYRFHAELKRLDIVIQIDVLINPLEIALCFSRLKLLLF